MSPTLKEPIVQLRNRQVCMYVLRGNVLMHTWAKAEKQRPQAIGNGQSFLPLGLCTCCACCLTSSPAPSLGRCLLFLLQLTCHFSKGVFSQTGPHVLGASTNASFFSLFSQYVVSLHHCFAPRVGRGPCLSGSPLGSEQGRDSVKAQARPDPTGALEPQ